MNLVFDDLVFSALAWPALLNATGEVVAGDVGYRDALCSQIGKMAASTDEADDQLQVVLQDATKIVVRLDDPEPPGPEMALLSGKGHFHQAWLRIGV